MVEIKDHISLVHSIARAMKRRLPDTVDIEDLVQDGCVGLVQAAKSFDPSRGLEFSTHASPRIRGAMIDGLRKLNFSKRAAKKSETKVAQFISLDHKIADDLTPAQLVADPASSQQHDQMLAEEHAKTLLARLNRKQREVVQKSLVEGMTLEDIGKQMGGVSKQYVHSLLTQALTKMRYRETRKGTDISTGKITSRDNG